MNEDEESKLRNRNSVKKKNMEIKNLKYIFRLKQKKRKKKKKKKEEAVVNTPAIQESKGSLLVYREITSSKTLRKNGNEEHCYCSAVHSCPTLHNPMNYSMPVMSHSS